jgi:dihydroorotase
MTNTNAAFEKFKEINHLFISEEYLSHIFKTIFCDVDLFDCDIKEYTILPGFCDVHVHFREPGFSYKETVLTGSRAAARGGYTDVCTMPNLNPVPDCPENMRVQTDIIKNSAVIRVHPYGSITVGEKGKVLSDMHGMAEEAVAFSDDGKGVQDKDLMRAAMLEAKREGKIIAAHCEDNSLLCGGCIHDGNYAKLHGYRGISSESEYRQIERDIELADETGCAYHVCHISTKESVDIIRRAKARGINITCETGPHYLVYCEDDLKEDGSWKMNPPLRSKADRQALIEGICDGTIDMIATDHAPHSEEEKSGGLLKSAFGIVGLETAFSALYTNLVKPGIIDIEKLIDLMCYAPRRRFGIEENGFSVWKLGEKYKVNPEEFLSCGHSTPFKGELLYGRCVLTVSGGKIAWKSK